MLIWVSFHDLFKNNEQHTVYDLHNVFFSRFVLVPRRRNIDIHSVRINSLRRVINSVYQKTKVYLTDRWILPHRTISVHKGFVFMAFISRRDIVCTFCDETFLVVTFAEIMLIIVNHSKGTSLNWQRLTWCTDKYVQVIGTINH